MSPDENTRTAGLNTRLENLGWGVMLVTIGTIGVLPEKVLPNGTWLIVAGLVLLALNLVRHLNGIEMKVLSVAMGILALFAGLGSAFGLDLPLFAISLIVIGLCLLLKLLIEGHSASSEGPNVGCCGPREKAIGH